MLDTDMSGRPDAFNPAELLLASLAGCLLKGTGRAIPLLGFDCPAPVFLAHGVLGSRPTGRDRDETRQVPGRADHRRSAEAGGPGPR